MAKQRLKMYVWNGALACYTGGIVVALAATSEDAIEQFRKLPEMDGQGYRIDGIKIDGIEPDRYDSPACVFAYGGE